MLEDVILPPIAPTRETFAFMELAIIGHVTHPSPSPVEFDGL